MLFQSSKKHKGGEGSSESFHMPVPYQESHFLPCIHSTSLILVSASCVQLGDNLRGSQGGKIKGKKCIKFHNYKKKVMSNIFKWKLSIMVFKREQEKEKQSPSGPEKIVLEYTRSGIRNLTLLKHFRTHIKMS